jgi:acetoin utilization protein AcuB
MLVRDYMTPNPITVGPDVSFPEAVSILRKRRIRRLPVVENGRLVGLVVEEDLLSNQPSPATTLSIHEMYGLLERLRMRQIMTRPVYTVEGDCPIEAAAHIMVENKISCLPVMEGDTLIGIITETDIFKTLVEVLGGSEGGLRLTVRLPERVGELARLSGLVAEAGGNIMAVTTTRLHEDGTREVTIKEGGCDQQALMDLLNQSGFEVVNIFATQQCQPTPFG